MSLHKATFTESAHSTKYTGVFNLVVAYTFGKQGIGNAGQLPWHITEDMNHFKTITTKNKNSETTYDIVVMGRKTWESIPDKFRPLKDRVNIVLSNDSKYIEKENIKYSNYIINANNANNESLLKIWKTGVLFTSWDAFFKDGGYIELESQISYLANTSFKLSANYYIIGGAQIYNLAIESGNPLMIHTTEIYGFAGECDTFFPKLEGVQISDVSPFMKNMGKSGIGIWFRFITYTRRYENIVNGVAEENRKKWKSEEIHYLDLMRQILETGKSNDDRTGVGTLSVFGAMLKFQLHDTFPISTTKRIPLRMIFEELMLYISGRTDNRILQEKGIHIWNGNTSREFLNGRGLSEYREGDFGETYGFNMRHYGGAYRGCDKEYPLGAYGFDQLANAIHLIKTDPYSRRIIIDLWNPATQDRAALPSCLCKYQFNVDVSKGELNLAIYLRSSDYFLANNWNTCTGALLVHLICALDGVNLSPGVLTVFIADAHIYKSHMEQVRENLARQPYPFPKLLINPKLADGGKRQNIEDFQWEDIELIGYRCHPSIKAEMAV
jgi:dihydrofolate reductase/thymidylate synthase